MLHLESHWGIPQPPIQIQSKTIHIWAADLYTHSNQLENFRKILSQDECSRANRYKFEEHKNDYIITRGILRTILSEYLAVKPEKIVFSYNSFGKPYLSENIINHLHFNLSHSSDLAIYIFSPDYEVGIDIERVHPIDNFQNIAEQFFSEQEYIKLTSIPYAQRLDAFFKCWTRKEAFIKSIGNGLSYPLNQFEVSLLPDESPAILRIQNDSKLASKWALYSLQPTTHYEAAFTFKGSCTPIEYFKFDSFFKK